MKALLIGSGAVGIGIATALLQSNVETHLVARGTTAESIRKNGIERRGLFGNVSVPADKVRVFDCPEQADRGYDLVINSAKTTGNAEIAQGLAKRKGDILAPGGLFMLFQNGYGNEQAFAGVFDRRKIYHGSFAIGFQRPQPNISEVTVFSSPLIIGSLFGEPEEAAAPLANAINQGGIPCKTTDKIGKTLWAKLLYNCALNPLSAVLGVNYGGLTKSESSIAIMEKIIDEVFDVMHAVGSDTFWADSSAYKKVFFETILPPTLEHHSSTLQDMERKIPTEIGSLNGAVVRVGKECGIETPYNRMMTELILSAEGLYHYRS